MQEEMLVAGYVSLLLLHRYLVYLHYHLSIVAADLEIQHSYIKLLEIDAVYVLIVEPNER